MMHEYKNKICTLSIKYQQEQLKHHYYKQNNDDDDDDNNNNNIRFSLSLVVFHKSADQFCNKNGLPYSQLYVTREISETSDCT